MKKNQQSHAHTVQAPTEFTADQLLAISGGEEDEDVIPGSGFQLDALWQKTIGGHHPNYARRPNYFDSVRGQLAPPDPKKQQEQPAK